MPSRTPVTVRLTAAELAQVDQAAEAAGVTRQDYLAARILADAEIPTEPLGPVGAKTRQDIASLVCAHPMGESLGSIAENLADALDDNPGQLRAAIAKELKATLVELARYEMSTEDDEDFDFGSPQVGDAEDAE
jgi:hypothetical protein